MSESYTVTREYDTVDYQYEYPGIESVWVELHITEELDAPYLYGADADGNRGEERQEATYTLDEVVFPDEVELLAALMVQIERHYENFSSRELGDMI